jgi:hypothetical protein
VAGGDQDRDLLLPLAFGNFPGDVLGASVWILEYVQQSLHHDIVELLRPDWNKLPRQVGAAVYIDRILARVLGSEPRP